MVKSFFNREAEPTVTSPNPAVPGKKTRQKIKLVSIFLDPEGSGYSAMRVAFIATIAIVMYFWGQLAYTNVKQGKPLPDIPANVVWLVLGVSGSKVIQRFFEK